MILCAIFPLGSSGATKWFRLGRISCVCRIHAIVRKREDMAKWRPGQILTKCIQYHNNNEYEVYRLVPSSIPECEHSRVKYVIPELPVSCQESLWNEFLWADVVPCVLRNVAYDVILLVRAPPRMVGEATMCKG